MRVAVPENDFHAQLKAKGFKKHACEEAAVFVWELNGEPYSLPLPIEKLDDNGNVLNQDGVEKFYCPLAIRYFFDHVFERDSDISRGNGVGKSGSGEIDYNIVAFPKEK